MSETDVVSKVIVIRYVQTTADTELYLLQCRVRNEIEQATLDKLRLMLDSIK